jgi:hypothetical protein
MSWWIIVLIAIGVFVLFGITVDTINLVNPVLAKELSEKEEKYKKRLLIFWEIIFWIFIGSLVIFLLLFFLRIFFDVVLHPFQYPMGGQFLFIGIIISIIGIVVVSWITTDKTEMDLD